MIAVTDDAKLALKRVLTNNTDDHEACLRLYIDNQEKLQLAIDKEKECDQTIEYKGATLLLVEEDLADKCNGLFIDVENTPEGARLIINGQS